MVPNIYFDFVMDYAPYFYYIPDVGVDVEWGRGIAPAAFAIDFLYEAYHDPQFEDRKTSIYNKIVDLADFILTQQCTDNAKLAYGGFRSTETSTHYYSIDAMRVIPALLKAYDLTGKVEYFDAVKLAGGTFLHNMQHKPSELGQHDKYYGGFAQAVTIEDAWIVQMWIIDLYGSIGLKMLYDRTKDETYKTMINDALNFYRNGFESYYLHYYPKPYGDNLWHRVGIPENLIYDDDFSYALYGLYHYEGWTTTVKTAYEFINSIGASPEYPEYDPQVCWAGYVDVVERKPACEYYDSVTSGVLFEIRSVHDVESLKVSIDKISENLENFMFWGTRFSDLSPVENKKAIITVSWIALMFLKYSPPTPPTPPIPIEAIMVGLALVVVAIVVLIVLLARRRGR